MEPRLSYVIGRLDRVLRRRLAAAVEPIGLTLPAYTALSVLRAHDGLSNAHLARRSLVTPQSMSEVLTLLVEQGLRPPPRRARPRSRHPHRADEGRAAGRSSAATAPSTRSSGRCWATSMPTRRHASAPLCSAAAARSSATSPERVRCETIHGLAERRPRLTRIEEIA